MKYNEQQALEIIQRFGLNNSTNAVWRNRDKIPDRYFQEGFQVAEKMSGEKDAQLFKDIKRIFEYDKLNIASIARLTEIKESRMRDIMLYNITPYKSELLAIKKAINGIRLEATRALSDLSNYKVSDVALEIPFQKLKTFINRDEIKEYILFGQNDIAKKMADWKLGKRCYPIEHESEIIQSLMVFVTELGM